MDTSEFQKAAARMSLIPFGPPEGAPVRKRRVVLRTVASVLGVLVCTVWTFDYDKNTRCVLQTEQRVQQIDSHDPAKTLRPVLAYSVFIYLTTTGSNNWSVPADWNSTDNLVEAIGGGGSGASGGTISATIGRGGGGGGGGAFALKANIGLSPGGTAPYSINAGANTNFNSGEVIAVAGSGASVQNGGAGGAAGSCTPSTGAISGGGGSNGAAGSPLGTARNGGNGGTAAGPTGIGTGWTTPSVAGAGTGGAGSTSGTNPGGTGNNYGGGGGGGRWTGTFATGGGSGAPGIIRISYTPAATWITSWVRFISPLKQRQHPPRTRFFTQALNQAVPKAYVTPPQPSNLSWFQQNPIVKRKPMKGRKRFIIRPLHRVPRQLTTLPHSNLSWFQQNPIIKGKFRPRGRFCIQFIYRRKIDIHFLPLPSNLTWAQQNPLIKRKLKPRKRYVIKFKLVKVPKAIVRPPPPSNLSWKRYPGFPGINKARGRKRFKIMGRWPHLPRNVIGQFVPVTAYSPEGPGFQKWRVIKPKLERTRVVDGKLQK